MSSAVSWLRRPRVWIVVRLPGPLNCCTRTPGTLRTLSAIENSCRLAISSDEITLTAFAVSLFAVGVPAAVTITTVFRVFTSSMTSWFRTSPRIRTLPEAVRVDLSSPNSSR